MLFRSYVKSFETKSSAITATVVGFLSFKKYAIIELSNPPDKEIQFESDSLHASSKIEYNFSACSINVEIFQYKLK